MVAQTHACGNQGPLNFTEELLANLQNNKLVVQFEQFNNPKTAQSKTLEQLEGKEIFKYECRVGFKGIRNSGIMCIVMYKSGMRSEWLINWYLLDIANQWQAQSLVFYSEIN